MRYQTIMMREILTNKKAQEIIDYVSQIYGESYVGLWFFQAIGVVLDRVCDLSEDLMTETNPATARLLLDYWEQEYGIVSDPSLTAEQRQAQIVARIQAKGACTPIRLANAISAAIGGIVVEVIERTGQNEFTVRIEKELPSIAPVVAVIERLKPAHLTYKIQVAVEQTSNADSKVAVAMTHAEMITLEVPQK